MKLSIVIITLNEQKNLPVLLSCLLRQTFQDYEVIVVDSDSDDKTSFVADRFAPLFPEFRFHNMNNRGISLGRNTGADMAKYENILFLDADVEFEDVFLEKFLERIQKKSIDVASCEIYNPYSDKLTKLGFHITNAHAKISQRIFPIAFGCCLYSTKTLHKKLNGFDESITFCEDCDYVRRAQKIAKFRILSLKFVFNDRRIQSEGLFTVARKAITGYTYRILKGEFVDYQPVEYNFGDFDTNKLPGNE